MIGILQVFPEITNTNGEPLIYFPLGVIIAISMLKDFLEDHKRWKSDHEENTKNVECLNELNVFKTIAWKDLHIGNIVRVNIIYFFSKYFLLKKINSSSNKMILSQLIY